MKWPFCGNNLSTLNTAMPETMTRFKILTEYLLQLYLPYPFKFNITFK